MLADQARARRGDDRGGGDLGVRIGVAVHLQAGLDQLVAGSLDRDRLVAAQQVHEHIDVGLQRLPGVGGVETQHDRVGGERAGTDAQHRPATGEVVQQYEPVGHVEGVVIGQRDHPGAQLDVLGDLRGMRDEHHRVADRLHPARVVLPEPGLVEAHPVEQLHQLDVALQRVRRVLPHRHVVRRQEDAESHSGHGRSVIRLLRRPASERRRRIRIC